MNQFLIFLKSLIQPIGQRKNFTVRYMFPVFLTLAAVFGASVITSSDTSYVKLIPSKTIVMSGEEFYIEVFANAYVPVNALDIAIQYDPNNLEVLSVDKAQSVLTIWSKEPKSENGVISFAGGTYRRGFVGEHLLVTIKIRAKTSGKTEFLLKNVEFLAGDGKGTQVTVAKNTADAKTSFIVYDKDVDPTKIVANFGVGISADIDGDGVVSLKDISSFMSAWYSGGTNYDFNGDSRMNFVDFSIILAKSFLRTEN